MAEKQDDLDAKQRDLVARIYAGALDPSSYQDLLRAWDAHYETLGSVDARYHDSDFSWADEWIDHFERAGAMFEKLDQSARPSLAERLGTTAEIAFLVDEAGRVAVISPAVTAELGWVANTPVVELAFDPKSQTALEDMRRALSNRSLSDARKPTLLRHFSSDAGEPTLFLAEIATDPVDQRSYILVRSSNAAWHQGAEEALRTGFGLTAAEVDLVRHLYLGQSVKDVAETTGRSQATLRTQLHSVLGKIGVKGQAGLARAVSGLIHVLNQGSFSDGPARTGGPGALLPRQREDVLSLPGDINLHLVESGDLSGTPFFFIQTTTWPTLTPEIVAELHTRGIRLIAPYRAGVGQTTRTPLSFGPGDWAECYRKALDQLGIREVSIGGMCSGGVHALELAKRLGARCKSVLMVDTGAPLKSAWMINQMPLAPRRLFLAARFFPLALKMPYKLATADFYCGEDGRARGVAYFVDDSPTDIEAVKDPRLWTIVRDNFDYCLRNPPQAANDVTQWSRDTSALVREVLQHSNIRYLHGRKNLVHRAEHIEALTETHPNCTARVLEEEAQLLIYRRPDVFGEEIRLCL